MGKLTRRLAKAMRTMFCCGRVQERDAANDRTSECIEKSDEGSQASVTPVDENAEEAVIGLLMEVVDEEVLALREQEEASALHFAPVIYVRHVYRPTLGDDRTIFQSFDCEEIILEFYFRARAQPSPVLRYWLDGV